MALEWTDKISVGVTEIDDQHKELFRRTNSLMETCKSGKSHEEVIEAMQFLESYVQQHLSDEEELQKKYDYPEYNAHKEQHDIFLDKVAEIKAEVDQKGATLVNILKTTNLFVTWVSRHISQEDKRLGEYLATKA